MADSYDGTRHVELQPGDVNIPVFLKLNACSASTANDGSIPYGSTVVSATVTCFHRNGTSSTALISGSTESGNTVVVYLSYSTAVPTGRHDLTAKVTLSLSGWSANMVREFDLNRIFVKDR